MKPRTAIPSALVPGIAVAALVTACASATPGATRSVYTERGPDGRPVEVTVVFDAAGRVVRAESERLATAAR
ncbi:hypothetical protein [Rubrivivax gelatinosus]|uniref:Lipoprotein n=1 Tax=Rubrivivax gelatinosus TaxID=28068 RepID=A0A4R2MA35_RUBGE|nr:hypothetical protein [Rubrivivax gelatinosus]TCP01174.1 hypothetical protein EV684_110105 [Rubrivivax gelatinosus]